MSSLASYEAAAEARYQASLDADTETADETEDIAADLAATPDEITSALAGMCRRGGEPQDAPAQDGRFDAGSATVERLIAVAFNGLERDSHAASELDAEVMQTRRILRAKAGAELAFVVVIATLTVVGLWHLWARLA